LSNKYQIANETADNWSKLSPETEIDIQEVFFLMTIKGITRTCFGNVFNDDGEINRMSNSYHMIWNEMEQRLHIGPPEPGSQRDKNFHDCLDFVKSKILQIVRDRNDGVGDDEIPFVDALLKSRVSDDQIFADCLSFMVGGFHTSGYLLVWSIYYLSSHPDIFAKLLDEMKDRVGANQTHKLKDYVYSTNTYDNN
jgi:cytochrome P450 family 20 subfamily A